MALQARGPQRIAGRHKPVSGPKLVSMVLVLERFVIALAAAEAPTRSDPKAFIEKLHAESIEGSERFGHPEAAAEATEYADDLIKEIAAEAGIDLGG